jgi:hypothetical protein
VLLTTIAAATASHVEWNRYEIADLVVLDVTADLDNLAGDLVPEDHADWGGRAASNHVLVGAADVRRDHLEYDAVIDRLSRRVDKFWIIDGLNLDLAGTNVDHTAIGRHPRGSSIPRSVSCASVTRVRGGYRSRLDCHQFSGSLTRE